MEVVRWHYKNVVEVVPSSGHVRLCALVRLGLDRCEIGYAGYHAGVGCKEVIGDEMAGWLKQGCL